MHTTGEDVSNRHYSGWRNQETWSTGLHLDWDWLLQEFTQVVEESDVPDHLLIYDFADCLRNDYEPDYEELPEPLHQDLLSAAYERISWLEIAEHVHSSWKYEQDIQNGESESKHKEDQ